MTPEPCVACTNDAAPQWMLCTTCAASIDDAMLDGLIERYRSIPDWLARAQQRLDSEPRDSERYQTGLQRWRRQIRVYERLATFLVGSLAAWAGWPEVQPNGWTAIGPDEDGWQRFLEVQMTLEPRSPLVAVVVDALTAEDKQMEDKRDKKDWDGNCPDLKGADLSGVQLPPLQNAVFHTIDLQKAKMT